MRILIAEDDLVLADGLLRTLRARGSSIPVLILTAADSVEERVKGLDYGADDYMAKPFSLQELEACMRALTRRGMGGATSLIKHGPLVYDQQGRVATIDGTLVELSARAWVFRSVAATRRSLGQQRPIGRAPMRMGRRSQQQRD